MTYLQRTDVQLLAAQRRAVGNRLAAVQRHLELLAGSELQQHHIERLRAVQQLLDAILARWADQSP